jgi:hypothetical protein
MVWQTRCAKACLRLPPPRACDQRPWSGSGNTTPASTCTPAREILTLGWRGRSNRRPTTIKRSWGLPGSGPRGRAEKVIPSTSPPLEGKNLPHRPPTTSLYQSLYPKNLIDDFTLPVDNSLLTPPAASQLRERTSPNPQKAKDGLQRVGEATSSNETIRTGGRQAKATATPGTAILRPTQIKRRSSSGRHEARSNPNDLLSKPPKNPRMAAPGEVPYRTVFGKEGDLEEACADPLFPDVQCVILRLVRCSIGAGEVSSWIGWWSGVRSWCRSGSSRARRR